MNQAGLELMESHFCLLEQGSFLALALDTQHQIADADADLIICLWKGKTPKGSVKMPLNAALAVFVVFLPLRERYLDISQRTEFRTSLKESLVWHMQRETLPRKPHQ